MIAWFFLAGSLIGAWFTFNAFRPIYAPAKLAVLSFFAGWLTNELTLHHLFWQALAVLLFTALGALHSTPGQVALGVTMASWAGLWILHRRALRSEHVVEQALASAFGADYRSRITPESVEPFAQRLDWGPILRPFPIRHPEVKRVRDVVFRRVAGVNLKLDVYHHRDEPTGAPTLLFIHGGGWVVGSKNEQGLPLLTHLASRGWVCVNANYRLSPHGTMPDPLVDLKHAVKWIHEHGAEYGADPKLLVVAGGSAGGHLAALLALTANDPEFQPGFESVDTSVRGAVPLYGIYDLADRHQVWHHGDLERLLEGQVMKVSKSEGPDRYDRFSPIKRIQPDAPPFFVIHGDLDSLVPVEEARIFCETFRRTAKAPLAYAEIPGAQHAFEIFPSVRTLHLVRGIERFLVYLLCEQRRAGADQARPAVSPDPAPAMPPAPLGAPALA